MSVGAGAVSSFFTVWTSQSEYMTEILVAVFNWSWLLHVVTCDGYPLSLGD